MIEFEVVLRNAAGREMKLRLFAANGERAAARAIRAATRETGERWYAFKSHPLRG
jgi:hypothetical protein